MSSQQKEDHYASRVSKKKIDPRKMLAKSRIVEFFQWFVVPDVRKVASLKRRVRSIDRWKNGTLVWRETHFQVKMHKIPHGQTNFWRSDVQKWHAAVARSTIISQNLQNTVIAEQFWQFRCPKTACRCGVKHICKSKCVKYHMFGPLFEGQMSKNGMWLWHEAHL